MIKFFKQRGFAGCLVGLSYKNAKHNINILPNYNRLQQKLKVPSQEGKNEVQFFMFACSGNRFCIESF